jgi:hypothetical protein
VASVSAFPTVVTVLRQIPRSKVVEQTIKQRTGTNTKLKKSCATLFKLRGKTT